MQREVGYRPAPPLPRLRPELADDHDRTREVLGLLERDIEPRRIVALEEIEAFDRLVIRDHPRVGMRPEKEKALQFLRRHFYQYERYNSVRAKEMMEARVDAVFNSIRTDREFVALTKDADGRLPIPMKGMPATQATPNR